MQQTEAKDQAMYAVIKTGGKQYRVRENDVIRVEKLQAAAGETVTFEPLAVGEGASLSVGAPTVSGASVQAEVVGQKRRGPNGKYLGDVDDEGNETPEVFDHGRGRKVIVAKFKRRKKYRRKNGHRQDFTALRITGITPG